MSPRVQIFADTKNHQINEHLPIPEENKQHLLRALRLKDGAPVTVVCQNSSRICQCEISDNQSALLLLTTSALPEDESPIYSLAFALCKGKKNDFVCEKLTELGAKNIIFWTADRSISRMKSSKDEQQKLERWQKIATAAAMQSGRLTIPKIHFCSRSDDLISLYSRIGPNPSLKLVFTLSDTAEPMRNFASSACGAHLLIGPEGDLSDRELADFTNNGFRPATLGKNILRAETAALTAAAIAQGLWGFKE